MTAGAARWLRAVARWSAALPRRLWRPIGRLPGALRVRAAAPPPEPRVVLANGIRVCLRAGRGSAPARAADHLPEAVRRIDAAVSAAARARFESGAAFTSLAHAGRVESLYGCRIVETGRERRVHRALAYTPGWDAADIGTRPAD